MMIFTQGLQSLQSLPAYELYPLVGLPLLFAALFVYFGLKCALFGVPRSPRIDKLSISLALPRIFLEFGHWLFLQPVRILVALGVSANMVTSASLAVGVVSAVFCGVGYFCLGGWLMFFSFILDSWDGMVARAAGTSSDRGEFYDALIDRYVDFATFLGFMWYFRDDALPLGLAVLGMIGSSVMGYARAKGESVGIDPNVGWMQRHERAVILGSSTVLAPIVAAFIEPGAAHPRYHLAVFGLAVVALCTNVSAIWRAAYVMKRMPKIGSAAIPATPATEAVTEGSSELVHDEAHA